MWQRRYRTSSVPIGATRLLAWLRYWKRWHVGSMYSGDCRWCEVQSPFPRATMVMKTESEGHAGSSAVTTASPATIVQLRVFSCSMLMAPLTPLPSPFSPARACEPWCRCSHSHISSIVAKCSSMFTTSSNKIFNFFVHLVSVQQCLFMYLHEDYT